MTVCTGAVIAVMMMRKREQERKGREEMARKKKLKRLYSIAISLCIVGILFVKSNIDKHKTTVNGVIHVDAGQYYVKIEPWVMGAGDYKLTDENSEKFIDGDKVKCEIVSLSFPLSDVKYYIISDIYK